VHLACCSLHLETLVSRKEMKRKPTFGRRGRENRAGAEYDMVEMHHSLSFDSRKESFEERESFALSLLVEYQNSCPCAGVGVRNGCFSKSIHDFVDLPLGTFFPIPLRSNHDTISFKPPSPCNLFQTIDKAFRKGILLNLKFWVYFLQNSLR
jgi:hypothetical protein